MSLIRYVTLLLIFYQYDLVSSDDSSSDEIKSFAGARGFELVENVTSVWKEEETRQVECSTSSTAAASKLCRNDVRTIIATKGLEVEAGITSLHQTTSRDNNL
jgi:hypothetical protein